MILTQLPVTKRANGMLNTNSRCLLQLIIWFSVFLTAIAVQNSYATTDEEALAKALFDESNKARKENGLIVLIEDMQLSVVGRTHSQDMMTRNYQSHYSPEGEGPDGRVRRLYPELLGSIGENIGGTEVINGSLDPIDKLAHDIVVAWLNSPEHRKNLLNSSFTHMGMGVAVKGESFIATQVLSEEFIVLSEPLPARVQSGSALLIKGSLRGQWISHDLDVFLILPNSKEQVLISETKALLGLVPLPVDMMDQKNFSVLAVFNHGTGVYQIGFGQSGEAYFPIGKIDVK